MSAFKEVDPQAFDHSPFRIIGKDWMLVAAEREGKTNAMTASWGGFGYMWDKNVAYAVIRPQRFTKEFVDAAATMSLNFLDPAVHRKAQTYFGAVSGRDEDKIGKTGLTVARTDDTPYFAESRYVVVCRKLFAQPYDPKCFIDPSLADKWYPTRDFHTLYISEVIRILEKA